MAKVVLVGLGNMGRKYLSKLLQLGIKPTLCDIDASLREEFESFEFYCFFEEIDPSGGEKVIVAVNPTHHPKIARHFLKEGAKVLLEKPPALLTEEFASLLSEYGTKNLLVSEIERYSHALRGFEPPKDIKKIEIKRLNRGRGYIDPIWDLAWHDLYILLTLFGEVAVEELKKISETHKTLVGKVDGVPFTLEVAWNHPTVERSWILETDEGKIVLDFLTERRFEYGKLTSERKGGDKLLEMVSDFLNCSYDRNSAGRALRILRILEKVEPKGGT